MSGIRVVRGDITDLAVDAFVFYARPDLALGAGFGTAISVRGGPSIQEQLSRLGPVPVGDAVVTTAGNMKAKHIIHAVGPRFQEEDVEAKLRTTTINVLNRACEIAARSLALPAMGAGFYGIPLETSARVVLSTIADRLAGAGLPDDVILCLVDGHEYRAYEAELRALETRSTPRVEPA